MVTSKRVGSRKLNQIVQGVTSNVYGKYGFLNGTLVEDWEKIVGPDYANSISPEKITFPAGKRNRGALLVKASSHSTSLIFQHIHSYVIDRINTYYGYKAVDKIKVIVGKIDRPARQEAPKKERVLDKVDEKTIEKLVESIDNQELRDSLKNLGRMIYSEDTKDK